MLELPIAEGEQGRFLIVRSGSVRCAIPVRSVHRVVRGMPVTAVPGSARRLVGLAHHDGDPIAVLDLLELLGAGLGESAGQAQVIVVTRVGPAGEGLVGLAVDEAVEVTTLDLGQAPSRPQSPVRCEVMMGDQEVQVLDPEALWREK